MDIDTLINEKIEADVDFQDTLEFLSDEDKETAITQKKSEILTQEFTSLKEKAEKAEKAEELAKNYKTRAEKAELDLKNKGGEVPHKEDLTPKDLYALLNAKVPQEDLDKVLNGAKVLNLEVEEALKHPVIIGLLKTEQEYRESSIATNAKTLRPTTKKVLGEEIAQAISTGDESKIPAKGSKEAEELFWARRGGRR